VLNQAIGMHLQSDEERVINFREAEIHPVVKEEELQFMDLDTIASAYSDEAGRES
jgi:hypothetical protein